MNYKKTNLISDLFYLIENQLLSIKPYCHKLHGFARVDELCVIGVLYIPLNEAYRGGMHLR